MGFFAFDFSDLGTTKMFLTPQEELHVRLGVFFSRKNSKTIISAITKELKGFSKDNGIEMSEAAKMLAAHLVLDEDNNWNDADPKLTAWIQKRTNPVKIQL